MLTVGSLSRAELEARLSGAGLVLRTGPFANRIRSDVQPLIDGVALMYADYPVDPEGGFVDFHLDFLRSGGLRRWVRSQVHFAYDGTTPFQPLPLRVAQTMRSRGGMRESVCGRPWPSSAKASVKRSTWPSLAG